MLELVLGEVLLGLVPLGPVVALALCESLACFSRTKVSLESLLVGMVVLDPAGVW